MNGGRGTSAVRSKALQGCRRQCGSGTAAVASGVRLRRVQGASAWPVSAVADSGRPDSLTSVAVGTAAVAYHAPRAHTGVFLAKHGQPHCRHSNAAHNAAERFLRSPGFVAKAEAASLRYRASKTCRPWRLRRVPRRASAWRGVGSPLRRYHAWPSTKPDEARGNGCRLHSNRLERPAQRLSACTFGGESTAKAMGGHLRQPVAPRASG